MVGWPVCQPSSPLLLYPPVLPRKPTLRSIMAISKAEPGKTRVGWIGTGVMGRWMCQHLMTKGYKATVYNRSKEKAAPLLEQGAIWADTPMQVAQNADVVFAIVGFPKDVREVFLGAKGALAGAKAGA